MNHGTLDFETYSEAGYTWTGERWVSLIKGKPGLKGVGAPVYAEHPTTEVVSLFYRLPDRVGLWVPGMPPPVALFDYMAAGGLIEAHNSMFEYLIWYYVCHPRMGWPELPQSQLRCSAAKARNWGLPGALEKAGAARNINVQKDKRGKRLIQLLSVPKQPTKKDKSLRRTPVSHPDLFREFYEYNAMDVFSEEDLSKSMPDMSPTDIAVWQLDQRINFRGVAIDTVSLGLCQGIIEQVYAKYTAKLVQLTEGLVQTVDQTDRMVSWLKTKGVVCDSVAKDRVIEMLGMNEVPDICKEVLRIRQIVSGAAVKKLWSIKARMSSDGRLRDLFTYCGAERTGRWAGSGVQPQNLKSGGPDCIQCPACGCHAVAGNLICPRCQAGPLGPDVVEWGNTTTESFLSDVKWNNDLARLESVWGDLVEITGASIRGLFVAAPGHDLICSDFSAIEAVVLACLAGEDWRIKVFKDHGKIYEASASKATGIALSEILAHKERTGKHHPMRKLGKTRELANGYGGWIGANKNFGADKFMTEDQIKADVIKWRDESPNIVEFWGGQWRKHPTEWEFTPERFGLEGAVVNALLNPGNWYPVREVAYLYDATADVLYCHLPSGRCLSYHYPRLAHGHNRMCKRPEYKISYMAYNSDTQKGPIGWMRMDTYAGKLAENVTQAVAGDILKYSMLSLDAAGYPIVLHVHDEIVAEVLKGTGSVTEFERIMSIMPPWAAGWPVRAAGGWRGRRYRK